MDEEKSISLFYTNVNRKREPYVCSKWVSKINHKGQLDERFFIATYSQLYLCKKSLFGGSLSISREYPWVSLKLIAPKAKNQLMFEFQQGSVTIETNKLDTICKELSLLFYELFPQEFRANFNLPLQRPFNPPNKIRPMFASLFISFCHSLEYSVSDSFFKKLTKSLKSHPKLLNFTELPIDKKMAKALFKSLELTQNIHYIVISESWHYNLFENLSILTEANKELEGIKLKNIKKTTGFDSFICNMNSDLTSLSFSNFKFTAHDFRALIYCPQMITIQEIKFSECDLDEKMISLFLKYSERFENLQKFTLNHDFNAITKNVLENLSVLNSCITTIVLRNANINIKDFFHAISNDNTILQKIDLSLNIFTSVTDPTTRTVKEPFVFPLTLKELIIKDVKWETDSLVYMLAEQNFSQSCTVDYSGLTLFNDDWDHFHSIMEKVHEPEKPPMAIIWNDNKLDARFVIFLSKISQLINVDLSGCYYDNDRMVSVLNALVSLVLTLNLRKFSLRGSKTCSHAHLICELLPIMSSRNILVSLDISNNAIGSQGIEILQRFLDTQQLQELSFDGSLPTEVEPFINLMNSIKQSSTLIKVKNPKKDISQLIQLFPESKDEILASWTEAITTVNGNKDDAVDIQESTLFTSFCEIMPSTKPEKEELLETSWTLDFEMQLNYGSKEWEAMQNKYKISNLISYYNN